MARKVKQFTPLQEAVRKLWDESVLLEGKAIALSRQAREIMDLTDGWTFADQRKTKETDNG
jgi:hypothetical protein